MKLVDRLAQCREPFIVKNTDSGNLSRLNGAAEFASRVRTHNGPVSAENFKNWVDEVKAATGIKGKELFHPVRIALTGAHSGPDFDKTLPLIEDGSMLGLGIPSVCERIEQFVGV